jgi:Integrase core domain
MDTKMTRTARAELAYVIRNRYRSAAGKEKRRILDEFIAATGYHQKSAIRVLNAAPPVPHRQKRSRRSLYDEAACAALIVLWEASDRVCGKRLRALLPILLPALERHGHLKLRDEMRSKLLGMSAATIDRLLRVARSATHARKRRRAEPEPRRRIRMRTFADWNEPQPGSMEMDLVAHCGDVNRGSFIHSLVMTDVASGWTEAAPLVVREGGLVVEALERIRVGLPFALRALDVDNGSEFVNETLIQYCLNHGIELTRSRPYRKNDQAWIEQKNGAVVRRLLGYRRFAGLAAAQAITRLYGAARLFVNFFQPSFKLAEKHRQGAQVSKRYHPPQTPCERLLQAKNVLEESRIKLREVSDALDPLKLLEEIRAVQAHLAALADGGVPANTPSTSPNLQVFMASLSSAWRGGEVRPTFSSEAMPRYLRQLPKAVKPNSRPPVISAISPSALSDRPVVVVQPTATIARRPQPIYARPSMARRNAIKMVWPIACRRLEGCPNINVSQLFDELCTQFPGRFSRRQYKTLRKRVKLWREDARARGVQIGSLKYRRLTTKPRAPQPDFFATHWAEMLQSLEAQPDQTALELLVEFQARYPDRYTARHLRTLQRRLKVWRREAIAKLICEMHETTQKVTA